MSGTSVKFILVSAILALAGILPAAAESPLQQALQSRFNLSGYYRLEMAFRYLEPRSFTKMRNTLSLTADYRFSSKVKLRTSYWYYYDPVYDLYNYDTIAARFEREDPNPLVFVERLPNEKDSNISEFREFYADILLNKFDIRVGLQHIVWGVLEGVRVVDEINPMNFRELILPDDILDYRVPLWSVKVDHYNRTGDYQFILIPQLKFHQPAPRGSEWELFQEVPNTVSPQSTNPRNWEVALRWSKNLFNSDLSLSYFYTWDDFPAIFRHSATIGDPEPTLFPTYNRVSMFGGTFSKQVYGAILKAEASYVTGKYFGLNQIDRNNDAILDHNGEIKKDHLRWGVGLDFNIRGWDFSPVIVQWDILDYDGAILQREHDTSFNLYVRKQFRTGNSTLTFLWIKLLDMKESLFKPRLNFRITDRYRMSVGLDLFTGNRSSFGVATRDPLAGGPLSVPIELEQRAQFFGNFKDNDRLTFEMRYSF